jgi:hypothetical protein
VENRLNQDFTHLLSTQTCMPGQVGQVMTPPHPSLMGPHFAPTESHVFGLHPQWLATPAPPHVLGIMHMPQLSVALHPSEAVPQL